MGIGMSAQEENKRGSRGIRSSENGDEGEKSPD